MVRRREVMDCMREAARYGQQSRDASRRKRAIHRGPVRLPHDTEDLSGPCTTRPMTEDERRKYGVK